MSSDPRGSRVPKRFRGPANRKWSYAAWKAKREKKPESKK